MSKETSSEWLLRRKAELAAKDPNTKDLHTEDKVAGLHTEYKEEAQKRWKPRWCQEYAGGTNETKRNPNRKTWLLGGACCSNSQQESRWLNIRKDWNQLLLKPQRKEDH